MHFWYWGKGKDRTNKMRLESEILKYEQENEQTIPLGSVPGFVDWCIISSNWNVFEPGAAHTAERKRKQSENTN